MFDENNVTPYFWNYRVNTFNKTRICNNARVEQYQLYYMLYFMILTILQSSWSSLQKVFCASSCRTLHWIVLPSSIDLHYPHTVNKRTYSLSLSFPVWMCWIALTEIHHNYSQKLMQKRVCDKMCRLSVPLRHFWIECFYVLYLLIFCVDVLYIRTVLVVMFNGQKGDERILASIP